MKRTFKLIREYPGSPELGCLTTPDLPSATMSIETLRAYPEFWQEVKQPLFITEDGKDAYDGDIAFSVNKSTNTLCSNGNNTFYRHPFTPQKEFAYFLSREAAEKYIDENKPVFSKKQIREVLKSNYGCIIGEDSVSKDLGL